jgi:hypothetical protein
LDHVAVRGFDDGSRQRHRIEVQVGQRLGNTLPLKLLGRGLDDFPQARLVAISSHDRLPSFGRSGASLQELRLLRTTNFSLFVGTVQQLASWRFSTRKRSILTRALCWHGKGDVRVDTVPDPKIQNPRDALIKITACAICGSDLHLFDGYQPTMEGGDILGHENMGEVIELGSEVTNLKVGDRVVVPFTISCGQCFFCKKGLFSCCDRTNPNAEMAIKAMGHSPAGLFGFSHMLGGYAGGQAEYLRVPMADVGPIKIPDEVSDEQALFLSDIFPTGYMAAENAQIEDGDTVAIWGCGPVGQFAIRSAFMMGAGR